MATTPCYACVLLEQQVILASNEVDRLSDVCRIARPGSEEHRRTTAALARARQEGRQAAREYREHKQRHPFC